MKEKWVIRVAVEDGGDTTFKKDGFMETRCPCCGVAVRFDLVNETNLKNISPAISWNYTVARKPVSFGCGGDS